MELEAVVGRALNPSEVRLEANLQLRLMDLLVMSNGKSEGS